MKCINKINRIVVCLSADGHKMVIKWSNKLQQNPYLADFFYSFTKILNQNNECDRTSKTTKG